nr:MAG TPA_asm: hypothetical protein [Caudoviricetes sp.]DAV08854.1 MAG TPA: hypothetical protein [Caudoviricetes sp.]
MSALLTCSNIPSNPLKIFLFLPIVLLFSLLMS